MGSIKSYSREAEQLLTVAQFLAMPAQADGTVVYVQLDAAKGKNVTLRFNAGSASAYKWEVVGNAPALFSVVLTLGQVATGGYVGSTQGGNTPAVVCPLAGEYLVRHGADLAAPASGTMTYYSYAVGAAAVNDNDAIVQGSQSTAGTGNYYTVFGEREQTIPTAGQSLAAAYKNIVSGSGNHQKRTLSATPIRVLGP